MKKPLAIQVEESLLDQFLTVCAAQDVAPASMLERLMMQAILHHYAVIRAESASADPLLREE